MGVLQGRLQACPGQLAILAPLLHPLEVELELFLAGSPSVCLTWIPPAVISVKVYTAILCLSFSGCCRSFTLGCLRVSHSSSTLSHAPHPNNQVQIFLYLEERFCWSRQGWTHLFPTFLEMAEGRGSLCG